MDHGNDSPGAVEKKAHALTQQTLDAIRPAIGSAGTSAGGSKWGKRDTETPGQHRFEYTTTLNLDVPQEKSKAVMAAATGRFKKGGYLLDAPDPGNPRATATQISS